MRFSSPPALAALTLALTLTACGGEVSVDADSDGDGSVTAAEMKEAVSEAGRDFKPEPGQYSVTTKLVKLEAPGAPEMMANMMGAAMNNTSEYCLTPEMAERGFEESVRQGQNDSCNVDTFTIEGENVSMAMTCNEGGGSMSVSMDGKVAPTQSSFDMTMEGSVPELGSVVMQMDVSQTRIGECQ